MNTARELTFEAVSAAVPLTALVPPHGSSAGAPASTARQAADRLAGLLRREHGAMAAFLLALADFDRDRGWAALGHASLFDFLHRRLGLSAGAAQYRKTAAGLLQRFPEVVEPLRDGRLCLMSVCELARVLTEENRDEVLPRFFGLSRREAQEVAVELQPQLVPARVIVTPVARLDFAQPLLPVEAAGGPADPMVTPPEPVPHSSKALAAPPPSIQPLTAERSRLHITVSRGFLKKLEAARMALSHSLPGADAEAVLEAGLELLLERQAKRRGLVKRPRKKAAPKRPSVEREPSGAAPGERTAPDDQDLAEGVDGAAPDAADDVPAEIRREVFTRDGGRCQWPLEGGGICGSTLRVELDHIVPRGRGGPPIVENLRCLCRFHNLEAAREAYGDGWMDQFTQGRVSTG